MKSSSILLPLLILTTTILNGQHEIVQIDEKALITNTIETYFEGWMTGDTSKLGEAMHATCQLKNVKDDKVLLFNRSTYLGWFKLRPRRKNSSGRIIEIDVTGNIGSAKCEIETPERVSTDYFNLMKIKDKWYIVDKIATSELKVNSTSAKDAKFRCVKETVVTGLNHPWSICFLEEDLALITEKDGGLLKVDLSKNIKTPIAHFPSDLKDSLRVVNRGDNSGIFEIIKHPDFIANQLIYISYAAENNDGYTTKIIRAKLENNQLKNIKTMFVADPFTKDLFHFGGGMTFGLDGKLYFTIGERLFNEKDEPELPIAQDVTDKRGKIYRLNDDGTIPDDNPDFGERAVPGLYAIGIRAAQGITLDKQNGTIWFSEHGTYQGDELNMLKSGANYGWPIKTTGKYRYKEYNPSKMEGTEFTAPIHYWLQTIAPTGLIVYNEQEFEKWKGDIILPGLSRGSLWRINLENQQIESVEELFVKDRVRSRKVVISPQGKLYMLTDEDDGKLIRIKKENI